MAQPTLPIPPDLAAELPSAGFLRRLGAMVYDGLLVIAMALTTAGIVNIFAPRPVIPEGAATVSLEGMQTVSGPLLGSLIFLQTFAFFAFFWMVHGRTLGMQAWRLRVIDASGHRITATQALKRFIAALPSLLFFGIGYFWQFVDRSALTWPDRASGSRVVRIPDGG
ncbi:MAG: RDD family protein [Pseudomonadales bacterium]|jgi:uncharacterized RDD family membrane protein YckC|nr:RDD family protein [Pseudomonadales bacterium]